MTETRNADLSVDEVSRVQFGSKRQCLIHNLSDSFMRCAADELVGDEDSISVMSTVHFPNVYDTESIVLEHDYASAAMASSATHYNGCCETSTLMALAACHGRSASQFRVLHAVSDMRDSMSKMTIPQNTLIVQSLIVSPSGNRGCQTFAFLHWRLPGRKATCSSIYKDARPFFHLVGTPLDAYPSMSLDDNLHPIVKTLVTTFVQEAEAGMTPLTFFGRGNGPEIFFLSYNYRDLPTMEMTLVKGRNEAHANKNPTTTEHNNGVAKPSDSSHHTIIPLLHDARETRNNELSNNNGMHDMVRLQNWNDEVYESDSTFEVEESSLERRYTKRSRFQTDRTPKSAKRRRVYGGSKTQDLFKAEFNIDDSTSNKFLVLVEGIVESSDSVLVASHDYLRDIFLDGRADCMPRKGRLVELLPNSALSGRWFATIIGADGNEKRSSGFSRNSMQDLSGIRIILRHERFASHGLLSHDTLTPYSGTNNNQIHVSRIDPSISRRANFQYQCVVDEDDDPLVVGSISIAACEGCTSWSDANSAIAGQLASDLLVASRARMLEWSDNGLCRSEELENLLPIPAGTNMANGPTNIGVSFLCKLTSKESYSVLVGQDEEGRVVAVDVILDLLDHRCLSSDYSGCSSPENPKLNAENIRKFADEGDASVSSATSVASIGQAGINYSESEHVITTMKYSAELPVAVTPSVPTTKKDLSETVQSLLSSTDPMHSKLTLVTPFPGCIQDRSECCVPISGQIEYSTPEGPEMWPCEASDYEDCVDTQLDFGSPINFVTTSISVRSVATLDESGPSKIALDTVGLPRHATTPRSNFNKKMFLALSFMIFCVKIPENLPGPAHSLGRNLTVQGQPIFADWISDAKLLVQPIGYAIAGIELVSLASITFIIAIFGGL